MMASFNGLPVFYIKVDESLESNQGIDFVSLVDTPAIEVNWVALSSQKRLEFDSDKQLLYAPILIPDQPIYRYSKELGEYYVVFTKYEIAKMVRKFQAQQKTVNLNYQHKKDSQLKNAVIQEIWLTENPDKSQKYGFELPEGSAFVVAHIGDSKFWNEEVKTGNVRGFSIEGWLDMEMTKMNIMEKSKFVQATTSEGVVVKSDAEMFAVGVEVYVEDEAGNKTPAPDGVHTLDNGMTITVSEGKIATMEETGETEELDSETVAVIQKAVEPIIAEMRKMLETKIAEMEVKLSHIPGSPAKTEKTESAPVQLSAVEKVRNIIKKK